MFSQYLDNLIKNRKRLTKQIVAWLLIFYFVPAPLIVVQAESSSTTSPTTDTASTTIETGDALSLTDINNEVNFDETEAVMILDGQEPSVIGASGVSSTTVDLINDAEILNNATTTAETGENQAGDNSSIETGDAVAVANVVNTANTNIYNSEGFVALLNSFSGEVGTIDLRGAMTGGDTSPTCNGCDDSVFETINASNTASISNNVIVRSSTGENEADENGNINTGNAYAAANVVNVANTNIVDANYALLVFNNFGDWTGDLIFPNAEFFARLFFGDDFANCCSRDLGVNIENQAAVNNSISTEANTGENQAEGGSIETGNATAISNTVNQVNSNFINTDSFSVVLKIHGNWKGGLYNLPPGIYWRETRDGIELLSDPGRGNNRSASGSGESELTVNASNAANIQNNVQVYALTGNNEVGSGDSSVSTGDALAVSNVVNIANTNILGRNWTLAIINIFGDWNGDLSFGQPNLWLGTRVVGNSAGNTSVGPGGVIDFEYTIWNRGDADAHDVRLYGWANSAYFDFNVPQNGPNNAYSWNVGDVPAGSFRVIRGSANVRSLQFGYTNMPSTYSVEAFEPDADMSDNQDEIYVVGLNYPEGSDYLPVVLTPDPEIVVTKTNNTELALVSSTTVKYTVNIKNNGGQAYHAVLLDVLKNERGEIVNEQVWDLEGIAPDEEIVVDYEIFYNASTSPGVYTNYAEVRAIGRHPSLNPFYGYFANSNVASSTITIYASRPLTWDYEPFIYSTSTMEVINASVTSDGKTEPARPVDREERRRMENSIVPWPGSQSGPGSSPWEGVLLDASLAPVFLADLSIPDEAVPSDSNLLANVFFGVPLPWTGRFNFLVLVASVVLLHILNQSSPKYRIAIQQFVSML